MWSCDKCKREFLSTIIPRFTARDMETDKDIWLCVDCGVDLLNYMRCSNTPVELVQSKYDSNGQPW